MPIKKNILLLIFNFQKIIFFSSFYLYKFMFLFKKKNEIDWVFGVQEISSILKYSSSAIDRSYSVNLVPHHFYDHKYDFSFSNGNYYINLFKRLLLGPALLGKLIHLSDGFFYIWSTRFLVDDIDSGEFEFNVLKKNKKKIVCFFVGSDIRSPKLAIKLAEKQMREVTANYYYLTSPWRLSNDYEDILVRRAAVTDKYSDLIISSKIDQISYLKKPTEPFIYFLPSSVFKYNIAKFNSPLIKVVHSPSSPIIKGTQLVRSAITRLRREGYNFEYVELQYVSNSEVLDSLVSAHIVLNEFYGSVPGVFGVEAMANSCALMTSADEFIETDLPEGSNNAWLVTRSYEIYDNLKYLFDNPTARLNYAKSGYEWALENSSYHSSTKRLINLLGNI
jgi:hypothetical protein